MAFIGARHRNNCGSTIKGTAAASQPAAVTAGVTTTTAAAVVAFARATAAEATVSIPRCVDGFTASETVKPRAAAVAVEEGSDG